MPLLLFRPRSDLNQVQLLIEKSHSSSFITIDVLGAKLYALVDIYITVVHR